MNKFKCILPLVVIFAATTVVFLIAGCGNQSTISPDGSTSRAPAAGTNIVYTCPMHPEVVTNQPGDCPKCGMHLVPKG